MLNKISLIGRIGKDPEVRRLESGATVAKFSLATTESFKDKDGNKQEQTEWHNIVIWAKLAEVAEKWLKKGMLLYVDGKVTYREYTGQDNQKKYFTEIVCSTFKMLDGAKGSDNGQSAAKTQENSPAANPVVAVEAGEDESGELPF